MYISKEIYFLPYDESKYILYAPLKRMILLVSSEAKRQIEQKNIIDKNLYRDLKKFGIVDSEDKLPPKLNVDEPETGAAIFLTTDCNLRCIYCYSNAGVKKFTMTKKEVKNIIDFLVRNAKKSNKNNIHITFHGGGEPTYKWDLLTWSVNYAQKVSKESNLRLSTSISTNLFLPPDRVQWMAKNINSIQVSFDGPKDIQNLQRPAAGGRPTFDVVFRNLKILDKLKKNYSIRSTITKYSVNRMKEIVSFFTNNFKYLNTIHFEPMLNSGRGVGLDEIDIDTYIENFKDAYDLSSKKNIILYSGESDIQAIRSFHCGACGTNRVFLPTGDISSCFEVNYKDDPRSKNFFIGKMENGNIVINKDKINYLKTVNVYNIDKCKTCFAKWHCQGGCLAKNKNLFDPSERTCKLVKSLIKYIIIRAINGEKCVGIEIEQMRKMSNNIYKVVKIVPKKIKKSRIYF